MVKASVMVAIVAMILVVCEAEDGGSFVGGRRAVKDVKRNKEVQEVGRFSVKEFNRVRSEQGNKEELEFSEVVEAEVQVVAGLKYYMLVEAVDENKESRVYESEVVVQPWLHQSKQLLRFEPSRGLRVRK